VGGSLKSRSRAEDLAGSTGSPPRTSVRRGWRSIIFAPVGDVQGWATLVWMRQREYL
jgi:hypothetical protein